MLKLTVPTSSSVKSGTNACEAWKNIGTIQHFNLVGIKSAMVEPKRSPSRWENNSSISEITLNANGVAEEWKSNSNIVEIGNLRKNYMGELGWLAFAEAL